LVIAQQTDSYQPKVRRNAVTKIYCWALKSISVETSGRLKKEETQHSIWRLIHR
jgi:hypothetical protein